MDAQVRRKGRTLVCVSKGLTFSSGRLPYRMSRAKQGAGESEKEERRYGQEITGVWLRSRFCYVLVLEVTYGMKGERFTDFVESGNIVLLDF